MEMRARRRHEEFFAQTKTIFSIHNIAYQGRIELWVGIEKL